MSIHSRVFKSRGTNDALDPASSKAEEAELLSRATKAAVIAAKSILLSDGSEDMAIRTAKAAAFSVFCPNLSETEINSRKGSSYLKRRQFKKQAEVVASVALITAKAKVSSIEVGNDERDQNSSCQLNASETERESPLDRVLKKTADGPNKMSASSVVSGKTGQTAATTGISTADEQSSTQYVRIRQMDEPSAITNPTRFEELSLFSDPSESKRPTSSFVQETREKIRRRNNTKSVVEVDEHPMKLNMARKQKQQQEQGEKSNEPEETNWFENMTNAVNIAWAILTCGHDCGAPSSSSPVEFSTSTRNKDEGTLATKTGMEIKCVEDKDLISTVTPCPVQKPQGAQSGKAARGSEAPGQYRTFPEYRDEVEDTDSHHADSLVERWSQSEESEHSSLDESVSRLMHSFSSNESDEIQIRSALRETMERVVERSKHRRSIPVDIDGEPGAVTYVIAHQHVPEHKKSEFSVRTRKMFALVKKNARKRLYEG